MPTIDQLIIQGQPIVGYFVRKWAAGDVKTACQRVRERMGVN